MKKKLMYGLILFGVFGLLLGCSYLNERLHLEDDHFLEESAEALVEEHLGLDIDLSPESPEED